MSEEDREILLPRSFAHGNLNDGIIIKTRNEHKPLSDYKINKLTYPPTMEMQIRKLRHSMENWKPIILHANSILLFEKPWHVSAIIGGNTVFFTLLLLCNPNLLTFVSLLGLIVTVADYVVPSVTSSLFKQPFTEEQHKEYEEICTNIVLFKAKAELLYTSYCRMKVTNPKLFFCITVLSLAVLAWIGGNINNLFLTYLTVTFIMLYPGLNYHGVLDKSGGCLSTIFNNLVENAKSKVGQTKKTE